MTSCPEISGARSFGSDSSSRKRIGKESCARLFEDGDGHIAGYSRELLQENLKRIAFLEIIEEVLNGHTSAGKDGSAALDVRVNHDQRLFQF